MSAPLAASTRVRTAFACAAILYIALFWQLGAHSFWDPDEAHYAQTTQEMRASRDWLAPYFNGQPFFDKPVVFYWFQVAASALTTSPEAAARLPGAVAGAALVLFTGWFAAQLAGSAVGWVAAMLLAVNPGLFGLARYAILDAPFTLFLFGGVALLVLAAGVGAEPAAAGRRRQLYEWGGYLALTVAVCIKGPVALALCGFVLLIASAVSADARQRLFALHWIRGVLFIVVLSAPWFIYMFLRFRDAFVQVYLLNENLRLFGAAQYGNQPGWSFYLQILLVGFLPWTGLIIGRMVDQARGSGSRADLVDVMLWSWIGGITLFFSVSQFKLDHYIFPTAPALCIVAARAWLDAQEGRAGVGTRIGAMIAGPLLVVAGVVVAFLALTRLDLPATFLIVPASIVALGVGAVWQERTRRGIIPAFATTALAALYLGVIVFVLPALERGKAIPDLAKYVTTNAESSERVGTFQLNRWNPAFRFYVERPVSMFDNDADAQRFLADPTPFLMITTEDRFENLRGAGAPIELAYRREGVWATSGKLLWRKKGQPTVFVVCRRSGPQQAKANKPTG